MILEFGDYLCDACKAAHVRLIQTVPKDGALTVLYRHTPSANKANSMTASLAAICADEQKAFRRMHDQLIAFDYTAEPEWAAFAAEAGVPDIERFENCLKGSEARVRLEWDRAIARQLGVRGTPTFVTADFIRAGIPPRAWLDSLASVRRSEQGVGSSS